MLAVEKRQHFQLIRPRFRQRGDRAFVIQVQLLEIVELQRLGGQVIVPFAVPLQPAERPRDFRQAASAGNP